MILHTALRNRLDIFSIVVLPPREEMGTCQDLFHMLQKILQSISSPSKKTHSSKHETVSQPSFPMRDHMHLSWFVSSLMIPPCQRVNSKVASYGKGPSLPSSLSFQDYLIRHVVPTLAPCPNFLAVVQVQQKQRGIELGHLTLGNRTHSWYISFPINFEQHQHFSAGCRIYQLVSRPR